MAQRLRTSARLIGKGRAPGRLYDFGLYPGALFAAAHPREVVGEVFALAASDPMLRAIDAYEGCSGDGAATISGFGRISIAVTLDTGRKLEAWSYGLNQEPRRARPILSGDWIAHLATRNPRAVRR